LREDFETKLFTELNDDILKDIISLESKVFPKALSDEKIRRELSTKHSISILIAYNENEPVAYKVGFERSKRIYYSWIGVVDPKYRGRGIAKKLMEQQHQLAKELEYGIVCTQTDNSFKPMIILNLKSEFEIKGAIQSTGDDYITIIMEKNLLS